MSATILQKLKRLAHESADMSDNEGRTDLRMPEDDEVFAIVTEMLGANRVEVRCMDGVQRTARIPGKMQKRIWIREDDVVLSILLVELSPSMPLPFLGRFV